MQLESHPPTDIQHTLQALPSLTTPSDGPIQAIRWYAPEGPEPRFFHCHVTVKLPASGRHGSITTLAGGTALTREVALAKAVGEAVERYCAMAYDATSTKVDSYDSLGEDATDPRLFPMFHHTQYQLPSFPYPKVAGRSLLGWCNAYSLTRNRPTCVPASLVHLQYQPQTQHDVFDACSVSGYACGNTLEEAILRGLYEVIERDAFMIFWRHWLALPRIDLTSVGSQSILSTLERLADSGSWIQCSYITTDTTIPTVVAVMVSTQPGWPAAVVATAASESVEEAVLGALTELAANHLLVSSLLRQGRRPPLSAFDVVRMEDHGLLYASPHVLGWLDPLLRPRRTARVAELKGQHSGDVKASIDRCVRVLQNRDLEVIVVDLTRPEVEDKGFKVVKVLVPGMQPIDFGRQVPHLGGRRIYSAPQFAGYVSFRRTPWELNLFPHPFP